jgi:hypothetical protein
MDEIEEVLRSTCHDSRETGSSKYPHERLFLGETCHGRLLVVPVEMLSRDEARPITCYDMAGPTKRSYIAWRRTNRHPVKP